jgi:hypothetical protein
MIDRESQGVADAGSGQTGGSEGPVEGRPSGWGILFGRVCCRGALKARIARATQRYDFPEKRSVDASHTHNLKDLIRVANLEVARLEKARSDAVFRNNWDFVQ